jgi:glycosyltransferase involved in cell wall biosynthesis
MNNYYKIKSLHIAPTPFFANRGCHIRIKNEIMALKPKRIRIILCTYHHGEAVKKIDIRRIYTIPGYDKTDAGYSPFKFLADIFLFFLMLKVAFKERPHILHGHLHEGALLGWSVKTLLPGLKARLLMDMQGSLSGELKAYGKFKKWPFILRFFKIVEAVICKMPDHFVCSSEHSRTILQNEFGVATEKVSLVQDVVPAVFFHQSSEAPQDKAKKKLGIPKSPKIIIYTGSLLPGKGINNLLKVIRLLIARRNDLFFILAGYPENSVKPYIKQHGLTDYCRLTGEVSYDDLPAWLSVADIAVDPKTEASGEASGKIIHYMAAGLPVVCYDFSNNRSLLEEAGYYAKSGSVEDLALKISDALGNLPLAAHKGARGKRIAAAKFSISLAGDKLESIYNKIIGIRNSELGMRN